MYYLSVYIHIISAIFWIGGMLFTAAVLVPASRHQLLARKKGAFFGINRSEVQPHNLDFVWRIDNYRSY